MLRQHWRRPAPLTGRCGSQVSKPAAAGHRPEKARQAHQPAEACRNTIPEAYAALPITGVGRCLHVKRPPPDPFPRVRGGGGWIPSIAFLRTFIPGSQQQHPIISGSGSTNSAGLAFHQFLSIIEIQKKRSHPQRVESPAALAGLSDGDAGAVDKRRITPPDAQICPWSPVRIPESLSKIAPAGFATGAAAAGLRGFAWWLASAVCAPDSGSMWSVFIAAADRAVQGLLVRASAGPVPKFQVPEVDLVPGTAGDRLLLPSGVNGTEMLPVLKRFFKAWSALCLHRSGPAWGLVQETIPGLRVQTLASTGSGAQLVITGPPGIVERSLCFAPGDQVGMSGRHGCTLNSLQPLFHSETGSVPSGCQI